MAGVEELDTYTEISGGTQVTTSCDDTNYNNFPIPFSFIYNGITYTAVSIQCNGFIAMGASVSSSYTPISSGASNNIIVGLGGDQQTNLTNSEIRYETVGTSSTQVFVIQWKNFRHYSATGDIYNYQIRLYETSNLVEVVYGAFTQNATGRTSQVGLRGASNADFNNRIGSAGLDQLFNWHPQHGYNGADNCICTPEWFNLGLDTNLATPGFQCFI